MTSMRHQQTLGSELSDTSFYNFIIMSIETTVVAVDIGIAGCAVARDIAGVGYVGLHRHRLSLLLPSLLVWERLQ